MDPTTIENTAHGAYLMRCRGCNETYELNSTNCLGQPLWVFSSLCKGFAEQHQGCAWDRDEDHCTECDRPSDDCCCPPECSQCCAPLVVPAGQTAPYGARCVDCVP